MNKQAKILSVNISEIRGIRKNSVPEAEVRPGHGIVGDSHAGRDPIKQISLLAIESHQKMIERGADVTPGSFGENITTVGIDLPALPVGAKLRCGEVELEVTRIGKECHTRCAIYYTAGDCVMPKEGIFARALSTGILRAGDKIEIL